MIIYNCMHAVNILKIIITLEKKPTWKHIALAGGLTTITA